jgi:hypothetical protein
MHYFAFALKILANKERMKGSLKSLIPKKHTAKE